MESTISADPGSLSERAVRSQCALEHFAAEVSMVPISLVAALLVAAYVDSDTPQQKSATSSATDWRDELRAAYLRHRETLEAVDRRNRKLFGDPNILLDISEETQFASAADYKTAACAASDWLEHQFPVLHGAFAAGQVETCANVTTGTIYLRGRAPTVDFVASVPIADVTMGGACGEPWSITFVSRTEDAPFGGHPATIGGQSVPEAARRVERVVSRFGDVAIETIQPVSTTAPTTAPLLMRLHAEGAFRTLKLAGSLEIVIAPPVLHLKLSAIRPPGLLMPKPYLLQTKSGPQRVPDWEGVTNVRAQ